MIKYASVALSALLLCGCASYRVKPLRKLTKETAQFVQEKNNIQVCASRIEKTEFEEYVPGEGFSCPDFYVPVLITVSNLGDHKLLLSKNDFSIYCLTVSEAVHELYAKQSYAITKMGKTILFFVSGVFVGGLLMGLPHHFWPGMEAAALLMGATMPLIFVGALIESIGSNLSLKHALRDSLYASQLNSLCMRGQEQTSFLLIVEKNELLKPFLMHIFDSDAHEKIAFLIDLS